MTLIFLPAMYAIWFRIRPENRLTTVRRCTLRGNSLCRTWARHAVRPGPGQRQAGKDTGTA
jgi:hypothetical protein